MAKKETVPVYQLKVVLSDSNPPIWRQFTVPSSIPLPKLHRVLQVVMGWTDTHLHEFTFGRERFGVPDLDWKDKVQNEARVPLNQLLKKVKQKLRYDYDFGDGWEHDIILEKIIPSDEAPSKPTCIAGELACPPEDCGGTFGYYDLLEALEDEKHPNHKDAMEYYGDTIDQNAFDIDEINEILSKRR